MERWRSEEVKLQGVHIQYMGGKQGCSRGLSPSGVALVSETAGKGGWSEAVGADEQILFRLNTEA